jgi:hypothetical protein
MSYPATKMVTLKMRPVRPSWQALECLLTVAIEIKQTSLAAPRPKADMLDFGPYDDLVSTNQKSVPEVREWMVADAVAFEPVSTPEFPANREINREFCKIQRSATNVRGLDTSKSNGFQ